MSEVEDQAHDPDTSELAPVEPASEIDSETAKHDAEEGDEIVADDEGDGDAAPGDADDAEQDD